MKPDASIIIVSYNNFGSTTGPCLESLMADPRNSANEIIVVDNASSDETPERLRQLAATADNLRPVLNRTNRGFAGGNNDGVAVARGDIVILLNSDTIVPTGSMANLARLLAENPDWALLGPVTNAAGNEQQIFTRGLTSSDIMAEGETWCAHSQSFHFPSERLDFFCVAVRTETYHQLGGLDENFGLGYYEDTAFSARTKRAGKQMMVTEDIFVYHLGGKSFSGLQQRKRREVMRENRKKLRKNYGRDVVLHHLRDRNLYVLNEYVIRKAGATTEERAFLDFKFANRFTLARSLYPNNPLKKLRYYLALRNISRKYGYDSG
jgi:GT2 family glycosyltransferase